MKMYRVTGGVLALPPATTLRLPLAAARERGHLLTGVRDDGDGFVLATTLGHQQFKAGEVVGLAAVAKSQVGLVEPLKRK